MALNPREIERLTATGCVSKDDRRSADILEIQIDADLSIRYKRGIVVELMLPPSTNKTVIHELARRYSSVGWVVNIDHPAHSGDFWVFALTPRRNIYRSDPCFCQKIW